MNWRVPIGKPSIGPLEVDAVVNALIDGQISGRTGAAERFAKRLPYFTGRPTIAVSSGTAALHLALLALGIGAGDEVIVPALTFASCASAVSHVGAKLVLVDVDPKTLCATPDAILAKVTERTRAIMVVHLLGNLVDVPALQARLPRNIPVIEDCCEAFGNPNAGRYGRFAAYSFFANKPVAAGEGGALAGDLGDVQEAWLWADCGRAGEDYQHIRPGLNYRMSGLAAALAYAQLGRFDQLRGDRARRIDAYANLLPGTGHWLFAADIGTVKRRNDCLKALRQVGIEGRSMFYPLGLQQPFWSDERFPGAERAAAGYIMLPSGPHVTMEQVAEIAGIVERFT